MKQTDAVDVTLLIRRFGAVCIGMKKPLFLCVVDPHATAFDKVKDLKKEIPP